MVIDLRLLIFVLALKEWKKDYINILVKNGIIIKEFISKNLHSLLNNKIATKIYTIFINKLKHIFSIRVTYIFVNTTM